MNCDSLLQHSSPAWLKLFVDHTHTHSVNNLRWQPHDSPDWRHFRESHVTDGEPETAVSASLQKIKSIKNQHKLLLFSFFYFIKSQISDSFVNHLDGHFAYLKTLDFFFKPFFFSFLFSHWHVKGFSSKFSLSFSESRSVIGPENILFAGASLHHSARKFYMLGQWRG